MWGTEGEENEQGDFWKSPPAPPKTLNLGGEKESVGLGMKDDPSVERVFFVFGDC